MMALLIKIEWKKWGAIQDRTFGLLLSYLLARDKNFPLHYFASGLNIGN